MKVWSAMDTTTTGRLAEWVRQHEAGPIGELSDPADQYRTLEDLFAPRDAGAVKSPAGGGAAAPPMRILFLTHYFPPEVNAPASRTYEMCKRWVRAGHNVTVITCVPNCPTGVVFPGYFNWPLQRETMDGIRVVRVWTFLAANKGKRRRALNFLSYMVMAT